MVAAEGTPDGVETLCERPANAGQEAMPDGVPTVCERVADLDSRMVAAEGMPDGVSTLCERPASAGQEAMPDGVPTVCQPAMAARSLATPAGMPAAQQALPTLLTNRG